MNPTNNTVRSTQILTKKIKLDNKIEPHISVKDQITNIFKDHKVFSDSFRYGDANSKKTILKDPYCCNGFAAAIFHAYNYHKHLRLSPDDVWLTISQGVSRHINYNAEKFRNKFVKHDGKELVSIFVGDIISETTLEGDWPEAVNRLVIKTGERVETIDLKELLECNFSTTTSSVLAASRIVLLDMVKAYFNYKLCFRCGIPKITLEGSLEDWTKLQEKIVRLRNLNLELDFWLDRLEPVILNLVATYLGEVNEDFWGRIVKIDEVFGSGGGTFITGWMLAFFPYNRSGNPLKHDRAELDDIPDGIVEVPFTTDIGLDLKFTAGFFGANQEVLDGESVVSPHESFVDLNKALAINLNGTTALNNHESLADFNKPLKIVNVGRDEKSFDKLDDCYVIGSS
ncbi:12593_t:CDS:2 [Cetraspora pellucida]|uniref:12593_t:CDS:1 n=1 Tax=Cetraspora pellucida TaxID=1433469 RepID=A0A9N9P042_9GLOM|nr:12593_t:CDS:2 [Cetraspora pellucida]